MKTHIRRSGVSHTVTISFTIPTAAIIAAMIGLVIGFIIGMIISAGIEIWTPILALPALRAVRVRVSGVQTPAQPRKVIPLHPVDHPAVRALARVPAPVLDGLDCMVTRVLREKYESAA